jgi:hypothetical protein
MTVLNAVYTNMECAKSLSCKGLYALVLKTLYKKVVRVGKKIFHICHRQGIASAVTSKKTA